MIGTNIILFWIKVYVLEKNCFKIFSKIKKGLQSTEDLVTLRKLSAGTEAKAE